jgi:hypothetical protein
MLKRSYVIDSEEVKLREMYSKMSDAKLREIQSQKVPHCQQHAVLAQVLYERDFWKRFWTTGLPGWIGLGISSILLVCHIAGH